MSVPQEHDYITCLLSEAPPPPLPPPTEKLAAASDLTKKSSNGGGGGGDDSLILRETELRLGLPGSNSPSLATIFMSGSKRGFTEAIDLCEGVKKEVGAVEEEGKQGSGDNDNNGSPASKGQVVGWPPIRSFRKSTMASNLAKNDEDAEGNMGFGCLYVKVSMEGAPYLRKVDLKTYSNYMELSSALEKMFSCFTIGKCSSQGLYGRDGLNETSLKNLRHDSENVLTYEDKDGDWMLVGDVPWEVFTESCKKLRIIKGSEAIGLAPRAMEKCNARTATDKAFLTALQISSRAN